MARKKYSMTEARIRRFIQEGRGKGSGAEYKPWHTVADVPSLGRVHRPYGNKTKRQHHLLSDNEYFAFLLFEWDDNVIDIREQYPLLDRRETTEIAARYGIKHPVDPQSGALWVMTTDFLLTIETESGTDLVARSIKQSDDLANQRALEKLEIERRYWERRQIEWKLLTEEQLKSQFTSNLAWIYDNDIFDRRSREHILDRFCQEFVLIKSTDQYLPVKKACRIIDERMARVEGDGLATLRTLLWCKRITTNLDLSKLFDQPISKFALWKGAPVHE